MSLLFQVVFASCCRSTHHKLALDALRFLRGHDAQEWMDVFLFWHDAYLEGSKAPDDQFKDFKNHVLHVRDNYWGGAVAAAQTWHEKTVAALKKGAWEDAVFSAGVLSHYYADPLMPFHTGQTEAEGAVHRPAEWSITKSYEELQNILLHDLGGYPDFEAPAGADWLAQMVRQGAEKSNPSYETLLDHYDLAKGLKDPPAGLDQEIKDCIAACLGHAVIGIARILERVIDEADVAPPQVNVTLRGFLTALQTPIRYVTNKIADEADRRQIEAIYAEVQQTGRCRENLPEDDKTIRELHASEVLKVPLSDLDKQPPRPAGQKHGQGAPGRYRGIRAVTTPVFGSRPPARPAALIAPLRVQPVVRPAPSQPARPLVPAAARPEVRREVAPSPPPPPMSARSEPARSEPARLEPARAVEAKPLQPVAAPVEPTKPPVDAAPAIRLRFHLDRDSEIVDAPSIGAKTADRLKSAGVHTVGELLTADADSLAGRLNVKHITGETIRQWRAEATLACRVPELRGHDAQILVASGVTEPTDIAALEPAELLELVTPFTTSADGQRLLRGSAPPDLEETTNWVRWAQQARPLKAA